MADRKNIEKGRESARERWRDGSKREIEAERQKEIKGLRQKVEREIQTGRLRLS